MRRPQNQSHLFWNTFQCQNKVREFFKLLWPSQNIWTLETISPDGERDQWAICTKEGFYTFNTDWSTEVHELCRVTSATSPPSLTMKTLIFWLKIKSCLHLYSISRKNLNPLWKRPFIPLTPIDRQRCMSCVGSRQQHPRPRWQWRL